MLGILPLGTKRSVAPRRMPLKTPSPALQEEFFIYYGETILRVGQEEVPVGLEEVGEGAAGRVREVHGEGTAQLDYDCEVV